MGIFDLAKPLSAPGDLAKALAKGAAQLPAVPLDMVDKAREGVEEGIEQVTDSKRKAKR